MPNIIDANGLQTATQTELIDNFTTAMQTIYGDDINLKSDTPDGELMNIQVQSVLDLEDLLVQINNMFDPDYAIGVILDQRVAINGIQRVGGTYTITNITVVTDRALNLYGLDQASFPVYTVQDNAGNNWFLIQSTSISGAGSNVLSFRAEDPGANLTIPNTITIAVTVVLGVVSVNNPTTYTILGINEESDAALKLRRQKSTSLSSQGYLAGLYAALGNINGLSSESVVENYTDATDANGIPSHSIWVIVSGVPNTPLGPTYDATIAYPYGFLVSQAAVNYISVKQANLNNPVTDPTSWSVYNPIAQAIYAKRNAGCGMKGSVTYIVVQINGDPFTIRWDTVTTEAAYLRFNVTSISGGSISGPQVASLKAYIVANLVPGVNQTLNINEIGTVVQAFNPDFLVTAPGLSTDGSTYTNTITPTARNYEFILSTGNIGITIV